MFSDINSILSRSTKRSGIKTELKSGECLRIFQEEASGLLGIDLARKIKPLYVNDSVITVASLSEQAVCELAAGEAEIILRVNRSMGENFLEKVRYLS